MFDKYQHGMSRTDNKIVIVLSLVWMINGVIWLPENIAQQPDSVILPAVVNTNINSEEARLKFIQDSIRTREEYIRDSILVREQFIKDSLERRQKRIDSLVFLKNECQVLLEAYFRTVREEIIVDIGNIYIIGDSVLGNYEYTLLPFGAEQPYTPWKAGIRLNDAGFHYQVDKKSGRISLIQSRFMTCTFTYNARQNILIISELGAIKNNSSGRFYIAPVDSVFYSDNMITKIKRYNQVYTLLAGNQKGTHLFNSLTQVRQFKYKADKSIASYQLVNFCERWKANDAVKVCNIINYTLSIQGNTYLLTRRNDPASTYSDGDFTFTFDDRFNLQDISFRNLSGTQQWQRTLELNTEGNVHCYYEKQNGAIVKSLCMIYHQNEPGAKYAVETITTTFEKDGISYYQKNNTTGEVRTRDRLTLEWVTWK